MDEGVKCINAEGEEIAYTGTEIRDQMYADEFLS